MIEVTEGIAIDESELVFEFVRASGPGGQNVNKVSTAAVLRFDVKASPSLPDDVKRRLGRLAGSRMTAEGVLILRAERRRTQMANRQDAIDRLAGLIRRAARPPKKRVATQPTRASRLRRLESKKRRGQIKRLRGRTED
ncbi:MAG: alternative ribosome rescue aminoacyl-tRNA hydrolase ArfB [Planctomycetota bacterium]